LWSNDNLETENDSISANDSAPETTPSSASNDTDMMLATNIVPPQPSQQEKRRIDSINKSNNSIWT
jgi:hypothetical protein